MVEPESQRYIKAVMKDHIMVQILLQSFDLIFCSFSFLMFLGVCVFVISMDTTRKKEPQNEGIILQLCCRTTIKPARLCHVRTSLDTHPAKPAEKRLLRFPGSQGAYDRMFLLPDESQNDKSRNFQ